MGKDAKVITGKYNVYYGHAWVEVYQENDWGGSLTNKYFLDVTATQFGEPPIFVSVQDPLYRQWIPNKTLAVINEDTITPLFEEFDVVPTERLIEELLEETPAEQA